MGSRPSSSEPEQLANFPKNLLLQLAFPKLSEKFQKAEFFFKTQEMKIHIPVNNDKLLLQWDQRITLVQSEELQQFLLMPKSYEFQKQGICGSAGVAKIIYGFFPYSLEREIENRKTSIENQNFSENQLWKLLYTLLRAACLLHNYWRKVGDIRPKNIFYNEGKQVRLSCQYTYPQEMTNYEKFVFEKQPTYLAPEELIDIRMGRIEPDISRNAKQHIVESESWSIGLTMLHAALLFNFEKLYEPLKVDFNKNILEQKILDLEKNPAYSNALKNTIKGMLEQIPERRLLCNQFLDEIFRPLCPQLQSIEAIDKEKLDYQLRALMQKKCANSLVNTLWKACATGFIESLVLKTGRQGKGQEEIIAKKVFMEQLDKFSQIPPKNSQVSMRESIRLGASRPKMRHSLSKKRTSQVSCQSFQTVNSIISSKKSHLFANHNKISNYGIESRFAPLKTQGEQGSSKKMSTSDKFQTPFEQSSYFQSIYGQRSFDLNNFGLLSQRFKNSHLQGDSQFNSKQLEKTQQENRQIQLNFKKDKR